MPPVNQECLDLFISRAQAAGAVVQQLPTQAAALQYVLDVCAQKAPCELLADEDVEKGPLGPNKVPTRVQKIVAAPDLNEADFATLAAACEKQGFLCLRDGLRQRLAGIDVGLTTACFGVAATGTCVSTGDREDTRLAGMISEIHIMLLPVSAIHADLPAIAGPLRQRLAECPGSYTTLITGPSRTADIERIGAIGVHGPLQLHVILLEDAHG